jgi:hypothetical protein
MDIGRISPVEEPEWDHAIRGNILQHTDFYGESCLPPYSPIVENRPLLTAHDRSFALF